jgi:hypothetical protein
MTMRDFYVLAFNASSCLRMLAYVPQIRMVARDTGKCSAVSCSTWGMFLAAHMSAAGYAFFYTHDANMALMFVGNASCCATIVAIAGLKRRLPQNLSMWIRRSITTKQTAGQA